MTVIDTKPTYASLKSKEEELLAQLHELREEIKIAENGIVDEKLNTAIQCLIDIEEMTDGYYSATLETFCYSCETDIDVDIHLSDIIKALQQMR